MGEECVFLKYGVELPFVRRKLCDVLAVKDHMTGIRCGKATQNTESGCFSAAGWPQKGQKLIFFDIEI